MTQYDLEQFFELYGIGVGVGVALAFFPFIIGYAIQSIYSIIKKS